MFGQESNGLQWMGFFLKLNSYRIITIIYFQGNIIYFESPCTQPREIHANAPVRSMISPPSRVSRFLEKTKW